MNHVITTNAQIPRKRPAVKKIPEPEVVEIDSTQKRQKVEPSKYFPKKEKPERSKAKPTYVNLDSDFDDSEDEFKPNDDELEVEEIEDEDVKEELKEELADMKEEHPSVKDEIDDDLSIQEIDVEETEEIQETRKRSPSPKHAVPKKRAAPKTPAVSPAKKKTKPVPSEPGSNIADAILAEIPDAVLPDLAPTEGKINFHALKSKQAALPPPSGNVELPDAAPNCLGGLTIVFTGVLPNLDRDASESVAKRYGARVTKAILKKTSLVVMGEEAGPSKVKKIKDFGIKAIDEAGFIELLTRMPPEGGDGANAQAARRKREEEEQKIIEDAMAQEKKELAEEKKKAAAAAKAAKSSDSSRPAAPAGPREIPNDEKLWTVKYAPTTITQLCGNKGQVQKLKSWLTNWFDNAKRDFKSPGPDNTGTFRAALISGPPGIGKTSAAHLVAHELGFDVLEKNASDVRSKSLLNSNIKSVLNNTSVVGFFKNKDATEHNVNEKRFCLIMDEVDGMSSGDHGGAGALSAFCRITKMPMILICNDRSLPKMRTFDKVTLDLAFKRPSEAEVRSRLLTIALRERIKLEPSVIGQLVQATGNDIRQIINLMSAVSKTQKVIGHENSKAIADSWKKHTALKPYAIASQLLGSGIFNPNSGSTLNDKIELYFNDIDFTPLMIQENYLITRPRVLSNTEHLKRVAEAADAISQSDTVNSKIRSSEQQWSLLPFHAVMSTVKPSMEVNGAVQGRINFTLWLGNNSKTMKYQRLLQELQYHTRLRTSTSKTELRLDYMPVFCKKLSTPLLQEGEEGIPGVIDTMDTYFMTREDWDTMFDFGVGDNKGEIIVKKIPTKVKSAFTRRYNAAQHPVAIYKTGNSVAGRQSKGTVDYEDVIEDDTVKDEDEEVPENDAIDTKKDKLIKEVKPRKTAKKAAPRKQAKK